MVEPTLVTPHDPPLVLLVDGDADTRDMYALSLTASGFAVDEARDGEEAIARLAGDSPDIVVSEIALPGLDGFALCRAIRGDDRTARIPVIAVTGYSAPSRSAQAAEAGFDALILKPCLPEDLVVAIRRTVHVTRDICARNSELRARAMELRNAIRDAREETRTTRERVSGERRRRPGP